MVLCLVALCSALQPPPEKVMGVSHQHRFASHWQMQCWITDRPEDNNKKLFHQQKKLKTSFQQISSLHYVPSSVRNAESATICSRSRFFEGDGGGAFQETQVGWQKKPKENPQKPFSGQFLSKSRHPFFLVLGGVSTHSPTRGASLWARGWVGFFPGTCDLGWLCRLSFCLQPSKLTKMTWSCLDHKIYFPKRNVNSGNQKKHRMTLTNYDTPGFS